MSKQSKIPLTVYPTEVCFTDIQPNTSYSYDVYIRNDSQQNVRMRIIDPTSKAFRLTYDKWGKALAPGLSIKVSVLFRANAQISDEWSVVGDTFKITIPIVATTSQMQLQFQTEINVGKIVINQPMDINIPVHNNSKAQETIICGDQPYESIIMIKERQVKIMPGETNYLKCVIKGSQVGCVSDCICIINNKSIKIIAQFVDEQLFLLNHLGQPLKIIQFNQVYIGKQYSKSFYLINDTRNTMSSYFKINKRETLYYIDSIRRQLVLPNLPQQCQACNSIISKQKCILTPYTDTENTVVVKILPTTDDLIQFQNHHKGPFVSEITQVLHFLSNNIFSTVLIRYTPKYPSVSISQTLIQFQETTARTTQQVEITIRNNDKETITIDTKGSKHFRIQGCKKILWKEEVRLKIIFRPTVSGKYNQVVNILVMGVFNIALKTIGICREKINENKYSSNKSNITERSQTIESSIINSNAYHKTIFNNRSNNLTNIQKCNFLEKCIPTIQSSRQSKRELTQNNLKYNQMTRRKRKIIRAPSALNLIPEPQIRIPPIKSALYFNKEEYCQAISERQYHIKKINTNNYQLQEDCAYLKEKQQFNEADNGQTTENNNIFTNLLKCALPSKFPMKQSQKSSLSNINTQQKASVTLPPSLLAKHLDHLSTQQLNQIQITPSCLQFPTIFINTSHTRTVCLFNRNSVPISLQLQLSRELSSPFQKQTKVDPYTSVHMNIQLIPTTLGAYHNSIKYIINKKHLFQSTVTANVTLINVDLSKRQLQFRAEDFYETKQIIVSNNNNSVLECSVEMQQGKHFTTNMNVLVLQPNTTETIEITYRPLQEEQSNQQRTDTDTLIVKVKGGAQNSLKCIGRVNEVKVTVKQNSLYLDSLLVHTSFSSKITLKNTSKLDTLFRIELSESLIPYLTLDKTTDCLEAEQKKDISFKLLCDQVRKLTGVIWVVVRGSKKIKIYIEANIVFPQLGCSKKQIIFGKLPLMNAHIVEVVKISNLSKNQIRLLAEGSDGDCQIEVTEVRQIRKSIAAKSMVGNSGKAGVIRLQPGGETSVQIKVIPKKIGVFEMELPFKLCNSNNIPICMEPTETKSPASIFAALFQAPPPINYISPLCLHLKCIGTEPTIYVSPQSIDFGQKIITEGKPIHTIQIQIINPHEEETEWSLQTKESAFTFPVMKGKLGSKAKQSLQVCFRPQIEGVFESKFTVTFTQFPSNAVAFVTVRAAAIFPTLLFKCTEIVMPAVPLNIQSQQCFTLESRGYDAITLLKWKTAHYFQHVQIGVNFIQGKLLSLAKKSIMIEVTAKCQIAISFTTLLELYDEFGNKYDIPLSITADNSICTNYRFLEPNTTHDIIYDLKNKLIKLLLKDKNAVNSNNIQLPYQRKRQKINNQRNINDKIKSVGQKNNQYECIFIAKWLRYEGGMIVTKYPFSSGDQLFQMVNKIAGYQLVKKPDCQPLLSYYNDVIKILKTEGALFNHIRPQYLLVQHEKYTQAWIILFYQLCKLYVFPQIMNSNLNIDRNAINQEEKNKVVRKDSTVQKGSKKCQSVSSQVYSNAQISILSYLNNGSNYEPFYSLTNKTQIFQILEQALEGIFNTGSAIKTILKIFHIPNLQELVVKSLYERLKEVGMTLYLTEEDLAFIGQKEIFLYLVSFILRLQHYDNPVEILIETKVGESVVKTIEVENPTNKKIMYGVKVYGGYTVEVVDDSTKCNLNGEQFLQIAGKAKGEIKIKYQCKFRKQEKGKLFLIPWKNDHSYNAAQPLAFNLKTIINSKIFVKKIESSCTLYSVLNISLSVDLPMQLEQSAEFDLKIEQYRSSNYISYDAESNFDTKKIKDNSQNNMINNCNSSQVLNENRDFTLSQSSHRVVRNCKDKLQLQFCTLTLCDKICVITYQSAIYGDFIFEVAVRVQPPPVLKELHLKSVKIFREENFMLSIPKENQFLQEAYRHKQIAVSCISKFKYSLSLSDCSNISLLKQSMKWSQDAKVGVKCLFNKAHLEYSTIMTLRSELDVRVYKICCSVMSKPKIVHLMLVCAAREQTIQYISVKRTPTHMLIKNNCQDLSISQPSGTITKPLQLALKFTPNKVMQGEAQITLTEKQTCEQTIYNILLKGEQAKPFDQISVEASSIFVKIMEVPLKLKNVCQKVRIESTLNRVVICIRPSLFSRSQKRIKNRKIQRSGSVNTSNLTQEHESTILISPSQWVTLPQSLILKILPAALPQSGVIQISTPTQSHFLQMRITTKPMTVLPPLDLNAQIGEQIQYLIPDLYAPLTYQFEQKQRYLTIKQDHRYYMHFCTTKEMSAKTVVYFGSEERDYTLNVSCECREYPPIVVPPIMSQNGCVKHTQINLINSSGVAGHYTISLQHGKYFKVQQKEVAVDKMAKVGVVFCPEYWGQNCNDKVLFQSDLLPNYQYVLCGVSQLKDMHSIVQTHSVPVTQILFSNLLQRKEEFKIQYKLNASLYENINKFDRFILDSKANKRILIKNRKNFNLPTYQQICPDQNKIIITATNFSYTYILEPANKTKKQEKQQLTKKETSDIIIGDEK